MEVRYWCQACMELRSLDDLCSHDSYERKIAMITKGLVEQSGQRLRSIGARFDSQFGRYVITLEAEDGEQRTPDWEGGTIEGAGARLDHLIQERVELPLRELTGG